MTKAINRPEVSNPNCVLGNGCKPATGTNAHLEGYFVHPVAAYNI